MLFIHISDIHFKQAEVGEPDDPNRALRNDMVRDVSEMREKLKRPANGILISGDIAYYGKEAEYNFAYNWLEQSLCPAAGCKIEDVFVVPGNHDVDRRAEAGPAQVLARKGLRETPKAKVDDAVRTWLRDPTSANVIFGPIENYNRFAAKFLCALRPYKTATATAPNSAEEPPAAPFARRDVELSDKSTLRLWGFSTVIVSDENDAERLMIVDPAAAQIEDQPGVTHLVMCHHPFSWLRNGGPFETRINAVAKIQLFGHEHTRRITEEKRYLRIRAGALQPARDEAEWKPGYNWIDIDVTGGDQKRSLVVKVWVRMHEEAKFIAIPDPDNNEIWENTYKLTAWTAPVIAIKPPLPDQEANQLETTMPPNPTAPTVRSIAVKFFKLPEHEQRRLISELSLYRDGDRDLRDYELVITAVRRCETENRLHELETALDAALGEQKQ